LFFVIFAEKISAANLFLLVIYKIKLKQLSAKRSTHYKLSNKPKNVK